MIDEPVFPLEREKFGKAKGIILGGMVGMILIIFFLSGKKLFKDILS